MCRGVKRGRNNPAEAKDAEESLAAGIAPVSGKIQEALERDHRPVFHAIARNMFEVEISASGAMRVAREGEGHACPVEPKVAGVASPGLQIEYGEDEIDGSASMRTKTVRASALRTDHQAGSPVGPCGRISNSRATGKIEYRSGLGRLQAAPV